MMTTISKPAAQRRARQIINLLVDRALDGRSLANPTGYRETVLAQKRTEHHQAILGLLLEQPHLDDHAIADLIEPPAAAPTSAEPPNPSTAITEWAGPEYHDTDGPLVDDPAQVHDRLDRARQLLAATRKPPMGDPPIPTRGAVHR